MTPDEYALRSHAEDEPELSFHTVWLYGWSNDAAFRLMQVLRLKHLYQRCLRLMAESKKDCMMNWYRIWEADANRYGLEYLGELKQLEAMQ